MTTPVKFYALRWKVLQRDDFTCQYCGQSAPAVVLSVDHVVPKALGGIDSVDNLTTACMACNIGKKNSVLKGTTPPPDEGSRRGRMTDLDRLREYARENAYVTTSAAARAIGGNAGNVSRLLNGDNGFIKVRGEGKRFYFVLQED